MESLNHALLKHFLEVRNSSGNVVTGQVEVGKDEANW